MKNWKWGNFWRSDRANHPCRLKNFGNKPRATAGGAKNAATCTKRLQAQKLKTHGVNRLIHQQWVEPYLGYFVHWVGCTTGIWFYMMLVMRHWIDEQIHHASGFGMAFLVIISIIPRDEFTDLSSLQVQYHPGSFWQIDVSWRWWTFFQGQLLSNMASLWYLLVKFRGYALADPSGFRGMHPSFHNIWLKPLYDMIHDDPSWLSAMILCYPWSRMIHHHHHPLNSCELIIGPCQLVVAITPFTPEEMIVIWPTFFFLWIAGNRQTVQRIQVWKLPLMHCQWFQKSREQLSHNLTVIGQYWFHQYHLVYILYIYIFSAND